MEKKDENLSNDIHKTDSSRNQANTRGIFAVIVGDDPFVSAKHHFETCRRKFPAGVARNLEVGNLANF
jgi:hypothetical protein